MTKRKNFVNYGIQEMLTKIKIFNILFGMLICVAPFSGFAAEDIECGYFNPAFGLCSVHSHNVKYVDNTTGMPTNPTKSEDVALMNEVIALKSTVIAQQLKEQYDQLNAIIKRFKTQLEKAVLTSKIEVATGNAASGNSGSRSSSNYNGLSDAEDCYAVSQESAYDCVARNLTKISQAAESDITNARKQLKNDLAIMKGYGMCGENIDCNSAVDDCNKTSVDNMNKKTIQACVKNLQLKVRNAKAIFDRNNAQARWGYR